MRLPAILKIVFTILFALWVVGLYATMPPEGIVETIGVIALAAAIFVFAYYFYLFGIRALLRVFSRKQAPERRDGVMEAMIRCPNTGHLVPIGIETEAAKWDRPRDYGMTVCAACNEAHWWSAGDVLLRPAPMQTRR